MRNVYTNGYCTSSSDLNAHRTMLNNVREALATVLKEYDATTIAVRGTSGLSIAYELRALSLYRGHPMLPFAMVRKDDGHHGGPVESLDFTTMSIGRYIILDDFISSGKTVAAIMDKMECMMDPDVKCQAIVLYEEMHRDTWALYKKETPGSFKKADGTLVQVAIYK